MRKWRHHKCDYTSAHGVGPMTIAMLLAQTVKMQKVKGVWNKNLIVTALTKYIK